ncbi:MAG: V4R domain-containing protein [Pseudomonadota bacterium]
MFKEERNTSQFDWSMIGNIEMGRPNLGRSMDVGVYRLMQFAMRDVLIRNLDVKTADTVYYQAGELAGRAFCKALLTRDNPFNAFVREVQELLVEMKIGILRVEKADLDTMTFTMTVSEDLDCSGLPMCNETICTYDEGFIAGLLSEHTGIEFTAREIDCWCSGARVCRFTVNPVPQDTKPHD